MVKPDQLPIAMRPYPAPLRSEPREKRRSNPKALPTALVLDTETRTDHTQRFMFGAYRFIVDSELGQEGLFYADDLTPEEHRILSDYAKQHRDDSGRPIKLLSRAEFATMLYRAAFQARGLVVGFNLPFDLSRIAFDAAEARGRFAGGFSLGICSYRGADGTEKRHPYRPRIAIKHLDSKRALKGFTGQQSPDAADMIPEGSTTGEPEPGYIFRGHFLDLRTLAFALTDKGYTLESACEVFGVEHGKERASCHGIISDAYIDYCRRDVLATAELAAKATEEYQRHPIELQATKAYSPASIGKSYLRAMGAAPIMERQPDFAAQYLGYAQTAFYGGRAAAHIRKVAVPVVHTDFLSMYPTVNALMGLWRLVTAERIEAVDWPVRPVEGLLSQIATAPEQLFQKETWRKLIGFVQVAPDGDVLPARSRYARHGNDWQIGVNYLYSGANSPPLWYSLPDVVASVLLARRVPNIVAAFGLLPHARMPGLKPVKLRGEIEVDPAHQDFFTTVIEQRKRLAARNDLADAEKKRLDKALKVLANSASYGIYAEMNRLESDKPTAVTCHGIDATPFQCRVVHPETPGAFCFPPLASLITGAARLMLALLERSVIDAGGTWAMEDTDSMAIVATKPGGLVACAGGPERLPDGREAVRALSWAQVKDISARFAALSPYDRDAIPGTILKVEDVNFEAGIQRQAYCYAISAKRYALFSLDASGAPVLLKVSEHGLGHLLNPTDPSSSDRDWIKKAWERIIRRALGLRTRQLGFENRPAIGRFSVSSPTVMKAFSAFNRDKPYCAQVKPFNFLLSCHVAAFGHPPGADPARFHLIAPYESDPTRWLEMDWIDQYSGKLYAITTSGQPGGRGVVRVKTIGEVLAEYEHHPEPKAVDATGAICSRRSVGLLERRHIQVDGIKYIGKESNRLEEVEAGLVHDAGEIVTEYVDQRHDEWETKIRPALKAMPLVRLQRETGMSRRALIDIREGRSRPHPENYAKIAAIIQPSSQG